MWCANIFYHSVGYLLTFLTVFFEVIKDIHKVHLIYLFFYYLCSCFFFFLRKSLISYTRHHCQSVSGVISKALPQFSSVAQSCPTLCNAMNCSTPGFPLHHQLPESTQTRVHRVGDAIQPSHPLSSPSPPALNLSQHQGLFKWVISSHQVA